jgi:transposase
MNPTVLTMTQAERDYAQVLKQVCAKTLTVAAASKMLAVSERHPYRMLRRYRTDGDPGLIHRLRGKRSNRGYPKDDMAAIAA